MAVNPLPCPTVLRQLFTLSDNALTWKHRPAWMFPTAGRAAAWNRQFAGLPVRMIPHKAGYKKISLGGKKGNLYAHRVIFALTHRRWPVGFIDHINGDPADNRPCNLREADYRQNNRNTASYGKTSKYRGVSLDSRNGMWHVKCCDNDGRNRFLGRFSDEIEAAIAYDKSARKWHGEFARLNFP